MSWSVHEDVTIRRRGVSRRRFIRYVASAGAAAGMLSFRDLLALRADELRRQGRSMILLWMAGGPSQFETFDPKPGTDNGGPTEAIGTSVPGIQIAQGWDQTAQVMDQIALVRSLTNREGQHQRASYQLHTGYLPSGSVKHPSFASAVVKEIAPSDCELPAFVAVGNTVGAGFLGVDYEPFVVNDPGRLPQNVGIPVSDARYDRRLGLLDRLEEDFAERGAREAVSSHRQLYGKAARLVKTPQTKAFDFADEPAALIEKYGGTQFGHGCLLARRLVEAGVTFVEIVSNGWDTHQDNFERTSQLSSQVDPAMAALISDLKDRGLLERTVVAWMGEFGRTPRVNPRTGRDHYPRVFSAALAGGGIQGGRVIGASSADGSSVADRPVQVADLFASICKSLQVDPQHENISPLGRPMKIVDGGEVVKELFA